MVANLLDVLDLDVNNTVDYLLGIESGGGLVKVPRNNTAARNALSIGDETMNGVWTITPSAIAIAERVVTLTVPNAHLFVPGNPVYVTNILPAEVCGWQTVDSTTTTTITYTIDEDPSTSTGTLQTAPEVHSMIAHDKENVLNMASAMGGWIFNRNYNLPIAGEYASATAARFADTVEFLQPAYVELATGVHSIIADDSAEDVFVHIKKLFGLSQNKNIPGCVRTVAPLGTSATGYSIARVYEILRLNRLIRAYAAANTEWLDLLDVNALWLNSTDVDGNWRAGYSTDRITPTGTAVWYAAVALKSMLQRRFAALPWPAVSVLDDQTVLGDTAMLLGIGLMDGNGGTVTAASGHSGTVADDWTVSVQATPTTLVDTAGVARADGIGFDQRMVITADSNADGATLFTAGTFHTLLTNYGGQYVQFGVHLNLATDVLTQNLQVAFQMTVNGVAGAAYAINGGAIPADETLDGWFVTPPLKIPAGATLTITRPRIICTASGAGEITVKAGRAWLGLLGNIVP